MASYIPPKQTRECYIILDGVNLQGECVRNDDDTYTVALPATGSLCKKFGVNWWEVQNFYVSGTSTQLQLLLVSGEKFLA